MLWLCAHLPDLALETCSRGACTGEPFALSEGEGREQRIAAVNAAARRAGVRPGMRVSEAHALSQRLRVCARERAAEREALERLAAWSGMYTSAVSPVPPDALLLEIEGSLGIFGGLERLLEAVRQGFAGLGYGARLAVAPTPLGATWLARAGREAFVTDHGALFGALATLPLACLELDARQEALLRGLGLACLVDCLRLPRDGLARRAGVRLLQTLDRAFGRLPDPRPAFVPPERFRARLGLPAPVTAREALLFPLHRLLRELAGFLAARAAGASVLEITLTGARGASTKLWLRLVLPSRDPQHLAGLVRERLERVALAAPVEEMTLEVESAVPLAGQPLDLFQPARTPEEMRARMVEQLQARLGRGAVRGLACQADHRPERAWRYVAPGGAASALPGRHRPLWLLPAPLALEIRNGEPYWEGPLALAGEAERIESGWWDGTAAARDYFVACHADGRCFWVYRERHAPGRWFLHGVFG